MCGRPGGWLGMLNKITGCESRTVPPLYVLMAGITGESRSLEHSGKADLHRGKAVLRKA